jgi:hypothetical protein
MTRKIQKLCDKAGILSTIENPNCLPSSSLIKIGPRDEPPGQNLTLADRRWIDLFWKDFLSESHSAASVASPHSTHGPQNNIDGKSVAQGGGEMPNDTMAF